jgi:hemoglobin
MLEIHAREGAGADLGERFIACFVQAAGDAALPDDPAFRRALTSYMEWAVADVLGYSPEDALVEPNLPVPRWGWNGPE